MLPPGHLESIHTLLQMKSESDQKKQRARLGKRTILARSDDLDRADSNELSPLKNKRVKRTNSSTSEIPKYNEDSNDVVEKTLKKSYSSFFFCSQQIELPVLN